MTSDNQLSRLSAIKLALLARQMREQGSELSVLRAEPMAIIGLGCRFPGGESPEAFWRMLRDGRDAISEVPPDRWDWRQFYDANPAAPGKMSSKWGGFLESVDGFDAEFFGISPREAANLDPQQRLFLEVAHEALDDAGLVRAQLAGERIGVFVASFHNDYALKQYGVLEAIDAYSGTGTSHSILANRLSYMLDLRGPSMSVDSACSASLTAVHLACESLRSGESNVALAAGVTLMFAPEVTIGMSKWDFLAPDGRCKTFDARADGFVRGEGCGVVVVKRLSDALADSDVILGLVRGSSVNQDGRTSVMTAPSGLAQQAVVRAALDNGAVSPDQISYIEAHGTGTELGDPIEVEALAEVFGKRAPDRRIILGAVKTNIGHLEAAAGIAGLIKVLLAMRYEAIPPNQHFTELNPHIDWAAEIFEIPTELRPWRRGATPRMAGVSSFGLGGTNAHVVVEEAPAASIDRVTPRKSRGAMAIGASGTPVASILAISAHSDAALAALASRYADLIGANPDITSDMCYSAGLHRDHFSHRAAVVGIGAAGLIDGLAAVARGGVPSVGARGRPAVGETPRIVFVFSGQGSQWWAMGRELRAIEPVFADKLTACDAALKPYLKTSLLVELDRPESETRLGETSVAQPAIFAIQVAIAALLASWGIKPDAVTGHSVGEIAAAHVAGALELSDAARLVAERGRIMQEATGLGRMASVDLAESEAAAIASASDGLLSVAAVNAPRACVLSGDATALTSALAELSERGVAHQMLPVNYAFHSAQMAPFEARLSEAMCDIKPVSAPIPMISTVTGAPIDGAALDGCYWGRGLRHTVRFVSAVKELLASGIDTFVEIAPHPVLSTSIAAVRDRQQADAAVVATLRRNRPESQSLRELLAAIYVRGGQIDWNGVFAEGGARVALPAYPWQRTRHWIKPAPTLERQITGHPLLGRRISSPALNGPVFETRISTGFPEFLRDHVVAGAVIMPGTAFIDIALSAARQVSERTPWSARDFVLRTPLSLADGEERALQCVMNPTGDGFDIEVFSGPVGGGTDRAAWTLHATATIGGETAATPTSIDLEAIRAQCPDSLSSDALYKRGAAHGIAFGPSFRGVRQIQYGRAQVLAEIVAPDGIAGLSDHVVHPALLDACLQPLLAVLPPHDAESPSALLLPRGYDIVTVIGAVPSGPLWSHASLRPIADAASLIADIVVADQQGAVVARIDGLRIARTSAVALCSHSSGTDDLYLIEWRPSATTTLAAPTGAWLIFGDRSGVGAQVAEQLRASGATAILATAGAQLNHQTDEWTLRPASPSDFLQLVRDAAPAGGWSGVLHLWNLDANATMEDPTDTLDDAAVVGTASTLHLAQALLRGRPDAPPIWLVSRGAQRVTLLQSSIMPSQALVWGFARALEAEHPELRITRLDLDPAVGASASAIVREIGATGSADREVAWREGTRYVPRLARAPRQAATQSASTGQNVRLVAGPGHVIEELTLELNEAASPGPTDIEICVAVTGLNFRDVLNAIGLSPGRPTPLGGECTGRVRRLGANVSHFAVGDLVMALAPGSFASRVVVDARRAVALPRGFGLTEAAGVPVAFLTAMYALDTLAGLRAGERVLIHAGAGGVGMAAIQVAKRAGAEVFATAGTPDKRQMLASLGVAHVMDSRTLNFAQEIDRITGGEGVDVVLNSLAGDFIARSFDALARGGRFVEIGKRDIWSAAEVARVRPDAIYLPFDLGDVASDDPETIARLLAELSAALEAGILRPLPTRSWPLFDAAAAFRTMAQARHTGKLVVVHDAAPAELTAPRTDGTYLITGGLGALGVATAQWMAKRGAGRIVLAGRNAPGELARAAIATMRAAGAAVLVATVDVAEESEVDVLFQKLSDGPPLRGIIHAAGVLDDGVALELTWQRAARVLAPKVTGASLITRFVRNMPLDFFVCYSSATGVFGSPGQSSYSAANAYLDALCQNLRMSGVPATSVQWGAWRDGGMAARQGVQHMSRWSAKGIRPMTAETALSALELAIASGPPTVAIMSVDWSAAAAQAEAPSRMLLSEMINVAPAPRPVSIIPELTAVPAARRHAVLVEHARSIALRVLGLDDATIVDAGRPLKELGLDSLTAIELRNALARSLAFALPPTLAFDYPTLDALATHLERRLLPLEAFSRDPAVSDEIAAVRELSDADAEAQLLAELEAGR